MGSQFKKANILVSTLGTTWQIIPEIIGFTNPRHAPVYSKHPQRKKIEQYRREHGIPEIDHVWCITTDHAATHQSVEQIEKWLTNEGIPVQFKIFYLRRIENLYSEDECRFMTDLIYRVTHSASRYLNGGKLLLSLAGGRKTMSADMQEAGHIFGCDFLLHVIEGGVLHKQDNTDACTHNVMPIIISDRIPVNPIIRVDQDIQYPDIFATTGSTSACFGEAYHVEPSLQLVDEIKRRKANAGSLIYNFLRHISGSGEKTNFRALYTLSPSLIRNLKNTYIGTDAGLRSSEIAWLRKLPKCDLHCHLGGVADTNDMVTVSLSNKQRIEIEKRRYTEFNSWIDSIHHYVLSRNLSALKEIFGESGKRLRTLFHDVPEPYTVAAFLSCFENNLDLLDRLIYQDLLDDKAFTGIGIERYEALGDLQGSGLLQSEESLRSICRLLIEKNKSENVAYREIRCSPVNYTRGELSAERVIQILTEELSAADSTVFRLIIIGSRHGYIEDIKAHVDLASNIYQLLIPALNS